MRATKKWTKKEEGILLDRYSSDGPAEISKILGRTYSSVMHKGNRMGLACKKITTSRSRQLRKLHIATRERAERTAYENSAAPNLLMERRERTNAAGRKLRAGRRKLGLCPRCGNESLPHAQFCLLHWAAMIGGATCKAFKEEFAMALLDKLDAQSYKCAVTGDILIPGFNASLDHIIAKSKGGALADLDNLQWVTGSVNFAKRQFTSDEFIEFCRKVITYHDLKLAQAA